MVAVKGPMSDVELTTGSGCGLQTVRGPPTRLTLTANISALGYDREQISVSYIQGLAPLGKLQI